MNRAPGTPVKSAAIHEAHGNVHKSLDRSRVSEHVYSNGEDDDDEDAYLSMEDDDQLAAIDLDDLSKQHRLQYKYCLWVSKRYASDRFLSDPSIDCELPIRFKVDRIFHTLLVLIRTFFISRFPCPSSTENP
jgi:hypothetical protein